MSTLMHAHREWSRRPADERFLSLDEMATVTRALRDRSAGKVVPTDCLRVEPVEGSDHRALAVTGPNGHAYAPTHWAFGQLCQRAKAPADYLRSLPAELAADALNWGLGQRKGEEIAVLLRKPDADNVPTLGAVTGPTYGRIWNADVIDTLRHYVGDGVTGDWRVPGEFGKAVAVTRENTTLYASDRDMFIFLADEQHRITVPNRRNGSSGSLARGFFLWNSEVGSQTFGIGTFLFDYVCCNRIVWGAEGYVEKRIRHSSQAPDRWIDEVMPVIDEYRQASTMPLLTAIMDAQADKIGTDKVDDFLAKRFGKRLVETLHAVHMAEEERPIETRWDVATAATAYARRITHTDNRVAIEREAGKLLAA